MAFNDDIADDYVSLAVDLQRVESDTRRKVLTQLRLMQEEITETLRASNIADAVRETTKLRRLRALLDQLEETIQTNYASAAGTLDEDLLELSDIANDANVNLLNDALRAEVVSTSLTRNDLRRLVDDIIVDGNPLDDWWSAQTNRTRRRFEREIRLGVTAGESNDDLVRRIRGRDTGRRRVIEVNGRRRSVRVFGGGVMDTTTREATTLVRTAVQTVSNDVQERVYRDNQDIIRGVQALVTLDTRTSDICISRSGAAWNLETGDPLPDSTRDEPYPGPPPWHPNCRTIIIPVTKSWQELMEDVPARKRQRMRRTVPDSKRASMDGEVAGDLKYEQWLRNQSTERQLEVLGPGKLRLWNEGKISLSMLVDQSGNPMTLSQLRQKRVRQRLRKLAGSEGD